VTQGRELRTALARGGVLLGLLSDQHAGDRGLRLPFLGRECSCSTAAAVYARRYQARLFVGVCYRTGLGRWRVQVGPEIPVLADGTPRSVGDITSDINRVFEAAIERDPANWFWVHRRWKSRPAPRPASAIPHTQPDEHATP
jgi:KDO2-lipid IV(A) lauroyltransferase